jgi:hypothetical protein
MALISLGIQASISSKEPAWVGNPGNFIDLLATCVPAITSASR